MEALLREKIKKNIKLYRKQSVVLNKFADNILTLAKIEAPPLRTEVQFKYDVTLEESFKVLYTLVDANKAILQCFSEMSCGNITIEVPMSELSNTLIAVENTDLEIQPKKRKQEKRSNRGRTKLMLVINEVDSN